MGETESGVRLLGRRVGEGPAVEVTLVRAALADDQRFRARLRRDVAASRAAAGRWVRPVEAAELDASAPWVAYAYVPAVPLVEAVRAAPRGLAEDDVRALGAALAEALERVHSAAMVHGGISADAVLVAGDGPRLTGFHHARLPRRGAHGEGAHGGRGFGGGADGEGEDAYDNDTGRFAGPAPFLSPEQARGRAPVPASDVFSLGAVLAYAASGRPPFGDDAPPQVLYRIAAEPPDLGHLSDPLAGILTGCLDKDPEGRPEAAALRAAFGGPDPAAPLPPPRLPSAVVARLAREAARALVLEEPAAAPGSAAPSGARDEPAAEDGAFPVDDVFTAPTRGEGRNRSHPVADPPPSRTAAASRRAVLTTAAAGAAGLLAGGAAVAGWVAGRGGLSALTDPGPARHPATSPASRLPAGTAPVARWRFDLTAATSVRPLVWRGRLAIITNAQEAVALDLRTGRPSWRRDDLGTDATPEPISRELALLAIGGRLVAFNARDGHQRWVESTYSGTDLTFQTMLSVDPDGRHAYFTATGTATEAGSGTGGERPPAYVVAYDTRTRRELWRNRLPAAYGDDIGAFPTRRSLVGLGYPGGKVELISLRLSDGHQEWRRRFDGVGTGDKFGMSSSRGLIYAARGATLRAVDIDSGRQRWSLDINSYATTKSPLGHPVIRQGPGGKGDVLYVSDGTKLVYAIDPDRGTELWRSALPDDTVWKATPTLSVTDSGRTVLAAVAAGVFALDARTGAVRWRFQESSSGLLEDYHVYPARSSAVVAHGAAVFMLPVE
ncbi:PQQ-binding-like beta-propeller repeat protein [Streptomyces sp. ME19-01-6]|uniref:outer membrane protein assembly factor BamB family protein n=1 Tax=Streptomyces sp. ME19-01-6 TaxID=3028686 RepID=UPI0029A322F3|nr:PQQ-binding-like beta-propeller repeat protein [Streptomyces sp. ME19-01-6]MDX3229283.1 PQQ-binding-like beta-propeller repeat protein [Streptomyces sp. ME19-01-6]